MFVKDLRLIMLFDFYGELLTATQKTMFDYYYNDDQWQTIKGTLTY